MRVRALERELSERLGTPVIIARSESGIDEALLRRTERDRLRGFRNAERRRDWLLGRKALKEILNALGRNDDTAAISFPDSQVSLTHAGSTAFSAGTPTACLGIGIDYEPLREIDTGAARWFLDDTELQWLAQQPQHARMGHTVRLWAIKEAAFKSHPGNARMTLGEFAICEPAADCTTVVAGGRSIKVVSCPYASGYLAVAIFGDSA